MRPVRLKHGNDKEEFIFHQWGVTYEPYGISAKPYTIAIIEGKDGAIRLELPGELIFVYPYVRETAGGG